MTRPYYRPRRLREHAALRDAVAETHVRRDNLMLPLFVAELESDREIQGLPGVFQRNPQSLVRTMAGLVDKGLRSFILFGVPQSKDAQASSATDPQGVIPRTLRAIRAEIGQAAFVATDVCVCSYTDHGHCGIVRGNAVHNDASIDLIANMALTHAEAGADMVAPSDMMDGRIRRTRELLDSHGFEQVPIMSYAIKYASSLYGPFRHAADSAPKFGDRRGYQMDFRNTKDALREARLDTEEGADVLMVKPGLAYLDILQALADRSDLPLAAYQVSGEYAMIRYAAAAGVLDERGVTLELWTALRRAGAQIILTYHAAQAVTEGWL